MTYTTKLGLIKVPPHTILPVLIRAPVLGLDRVVPPLVDHDFPNKNTWGGFNDNDTWDLSESVENRVQRTKAARPQVRSRSQSGLHPSSSF